MKDYIISKADSNDTVPKEMAARRACVYFLQTIWEVPHKLLGLYGLSALLKAEQKGAIFIQMDTSAYICIVETSIDLADWKQPPSTPLPNQQDEVWLGKSCLAGLTE